MPHPADVTERQSVRTGGVARGTIVRAFVSLGVGIVVLLGWSAAASADSPTSVASDLPTGITSDLTGTGSMVDPVIGVVDPVLEVLPPVTAPPAPAPKVTDLVPAPPVVAPVLPVVPGIVEKASEAAAAAPLPTPPPGQLPGGVVAPVLPVDPATGSPEVPGVQPIGGIGLPIDGLVRPVGGPPLDHVASGARIPSAGRADAISAAAPSPLLISPAASSVASSLDRSTAGPTLGPASVTQVASTLSRSGQSAPTRPDDGSAPPSSPPVCGAGASAARAPHGDPSNATIGASGTAASAAALARLFDGHARCSSIARARPEVAPD